MVPKIRPEVVDGFGETGDLNFLEVVRQKDVHGYGGERNEEVSPCNAAHGGREGGRSRERAGGEEEEARAGLKMQL